ncbi:hypothetical protein [Goodfellowiella coeruleoviolacea]|uniref:Uncharacterized protein n=1 Tax=Goodfellowiella coeruleoviolacea TaxID=334858 RepID=A0AAE3KKF8_9PSEU|nr:hypothetical protein [Goodfellowiella coeruleoviolacea]MCP2169324.1 hypothetical protein [Goodfellowiella coeruleoviolacea]
MAQDDSREHGLPRAARVHQPLMSEADAERVRRWHEAAYQELRAQTGSQTVSYLGRRLVVPPPTRATAP